MNYFQVLVASKQYHGISPLIYSYGKDLPPMMLVVVRLNNLKVVGIILSKTPRPVFSTKPIEEVIALPPLPKTSIKLLDWLKGYYPASLGSITAQFLPFSMVRFSSNDKVEAHEPRTTIHKLPPLTREQHLAVDQILHAKGRRLFLLHGDTGTGKTRVYLEIAKSQLKRGKNVLVLTPEIGLTPQLVDDFERSFANKVIVLHSNLSPAERRQAWLRVLQRKHPVVVIGPRSALFAPFDNLGLIVVDEAHDAAYKQEQAPYYNTLMVAAQLASIHAASLIIGSATPNVTDYYLAKAKNIPILRMQELAVKNSVESQNIIVVGMQNKESFSRHSYISDTMLEAIDQTLNRKQQVLVFLNRRGTSRRVLCQNCGWQALCPNCDLPLTYHGDSHIMRCHTCGYNANALSSCPTCKSADIIYKSIGTKSVVETLLKLFPDASVRRFDTDNKKAERFEQHYQHVRAGHVDILVGTQMLTKGLDLPKLGMVGVVNADCGLSFPDYTAEERTYQQLNQIIGRVGRGHIPGLAVIQTYRPDSQAILAAINKNWSDFYNKQLAERHKFTFPPYCHLLKISCVRKTRQSAQTSCQKLLAHLNSLPLKLRIIGPSPCFYEKSKNGYKWQLVVKAKNRQELLDAVSALPSGWSYDLDPINLL